MALPPMIFALSSSETSSSRSTKLNGSQCPRGAGSREPKAHGPPPDVDQPLQIILPERVHVDVAFEHLDGVLVELLGHDRCAVSSSLRRFFTHPLPFSTQMTFRSAEAGQRAVADHRRHGVLDGALPMATSGRRWA